MTPPAIRTLACCFGAAFLLLIPSVGYPHAELLRSTPSAGAIVAVPPSSISIWFSEPIDAPPDAIVVLAPDGSRVDRRDGSVGTDDRTRLAATLEPAVPGTYVVRWSTLSADGHPISGRFTFSLGSTSAPPANEEPRRNGSGLVLQIAGRWLHLVALVMVSGPLVLLALLRREQLPLVQRALWRLAGVGVLVLLPAAAVLFLGQLLALRGTSGDALSTAAMWSLLRSRWGLWWTVRLIGTVALMGLVYWPRSSPARREGPARLLATSTATAIILIATSLNGHAAATEPVPLSVAIDWIHLAATVVWIGGLVTLGFVVLPYFSKDISVESTLVLGRLVPRFSTVALVVVELLIVTGLYHTWAHVENPQALTGTSYGVVLLSKVGLIAAMLVPAAFNLLVVRPSIAGAAAAAGGHNGRSPARRLNQLVRAEVALAVPVLAAAAVLTALPPARAVRAMNVAAPAEAAEKPAVTLADNAGSVLVVMDISPARVGSNRVHVALHDARGRHIEHSSIRLRVEPPPDSGVSPSTVTPMPSDDGYAATVLLAPAGHWTIRALVGGSSATFSLTVPMLGAGEFLARADTAMNRLRSLVEETEISKAGVTTLSRVEYQTPDRIHRQTEDADEIVIGSTRYMQHGTMWHTEAIDPVRWPNHAFAKSATEVVLLDVQQLHGVECLVIGFVNTADGTRNRLWIQPGEWRILQHVSVEPGQSRLSRYSGFDRPLNIATPAQRPAGETGKEIRMNRAVKN